ncbi:hypothetical protein BD310DRAFT_980234 [Dichomitus squalens]|uniref:Uncharacterized protein n=1 Tax=Dichomitus squalens TaxID=114155 RepID=A0A4Q9PKA5_9APHY|nr:hypothetical protein BD310DRAFT_980234 [Dichomitus squalens]
MSSANPRDYNTEHWALWQQYADRLLAHFTGNGPNPGEPPAGYREVYCVRHRHAPLPEHRSGGMPSTGGTTGWGSGMRGVAMSEDAFGALLSQGTQWATAFSQLAQSMRSGPGMGVAVAHAPALPIAPRAYYGPPAKTWHGNNRGRSGEQDITTLSEEPEPAIDIPADTDDSGDEEDSNGWGRIEM